MQTEAADAEQKLLNATQRLQRLEQDVMLLKDKTENITQSTQQTNQDAQTIGKIAEEVKQVGSDFESSERKKEKRAEVLTFLVKNICFFRTWTMK